MRFGNTAFKQYHQKACEISDEFLNDILPESIKEAA
jgi:serine/threonine-protein phosphatase 2A activator